MVTTHRPQLRITEATKKKFLAGRGGIGVSSLEDRENRAPAGWLAAEKMAARGNLRPGAEHRAAFVMFSDD